MHIKSKLVDIPAKRIYPAEITVSDGKIISIRELGADESVPDSFILPGFIDAHVHIESSMLVPAEFARLAVVHGTVATVSDPHEIANVCGIPGIEFMIENGKKVPFKFFFGAPSCVPATVFETAGAALNAKDVAALLERPDIRYLSEMMNFPGVLNGDPEVREKIHAARKMNKPVDGHAPGLSGGQVRKYIAGGLELSSPEVVISTDHECFTETEALEKLSGGMKILIREGSAARNFEALAGLLNEYSDQMMFCSDDKHPDSLVAGHINELCRRAVAKGIDVFKVLKAACINPVSHYKLEVGQLRIGDPADFIITADLTEFRVLETYIDGTLVANRKSLIESSPDPSKPVNQFNCSPKKPGDFSQERNSLPVIGALDGQLITGKLSPTPENSDMLKIVVVNRYRDAPVAKAFISHFGLKKGAIASSVAHDSHNIVAVGVDDESICKAVNLVISANGGISCAGDDWEMLLPLPVAGLMSTEDGYRVAASYTAIDAAAKSLGSSLTAPFMTLSFMALLVIPHLKLSDLGLFDGDRFALL
jgi:adenine deaminase